MAVMARKKKKTVIRKQPRPGPPLGCLEVIELPPFSQKWGHYRLTEVDRTLMLNAILSDPEVWPVQRRYRRDGKPVFPLMYWTVERAAVIGFSTAFSA